MAASSKDIQLRELKDTISQLKTMMSEQTDLIKTLRLAIEEKSDKERMLQEQNKLLQEQIDFLTKKLFGASSEKKVLDVPGQLNLFDEAEVEQDMSLLDEETCIREHTRKRKATHADVFKGLKVNKIIARTMDVRTAKREMVIQKQQLSSNPKLRRLWLVKDLLLPQQLPGRCTRSMQTACLCTVRKRTGNSMVPRSAARHWQTGSFTARSTISSRSTIISTANC